MIHSDFILIFVTTLISGYYTSFHIFIFTTVLKQKKCFFLSIFPLENEEEKYWKLNPQRVCIVSQNWQPKVRLIIPSRNTGFTNAREVTGYRLIQLVLVLAEKKMPANVWSLLEHPSHRIESQKFRYSPRDPGKRALVLKIMPSATFLLDGKHLI